MARKPEVGKRVGGFLYVHKDAADLIEAPLADRAKQAAQLVPDFAWNVVKLSAKEVSLLLYEDFDAEAFPALVRSVKVNLEARTGAVTDYSSRANPPILHRKETLLRPNDPRRPAFAALTAEAEAKGLFREPHLIGTRRQWSARLADAGLKVVGNRLVGVEDKAVDVARHKTAIIRRDLSQPVQMMLRLGMVALGRSIFDYGCGQGDDIALLQANGYEAFGWDPYHAPDGPRRHADAVNLGFVLNVIENPHERIETLKAAWGFTKQVLMIAVMVHGKYPVAGLRPYKDGFLTNRGTFQRFFAQDDLREMVARATGATPVALAPGIVAVFRDKELEQEVGYRRRSRASLMSEAFRAVPSHRPRVERPQRRAVMEKQERPERGPRDPRLAPLLEAVWAQALDFGRLPHPQEMAPLILAELAELRVSPERALAYAVQAFDSTSLDHAAEARRDDLLVHFALQMFPGAPRYTTLAPSIQRDVRTFFGSHAKAIERARALLFSLGTSNVVAAAAEAAAGAGAATWVEGVLRFQAAALLKLPPAVRLVIGCAEIIEQDLAAYDFLEIEPGKGLVRAIRCDDVERQLPMVLETVEVDLKALKRRRARPKDSILYLKSRYMAKDDEKRSRQEEVDERLLKAGIVAEDGTGPTWSELANRLKAMDATPASSPRSNLL